MYKKSPTKPFLKLTFSYLTGLVGETISPQYVLWQFKNTTSYQDPTLIVYLINAALSR